MIDQLPSYPEYRESKLSWVPEIPSHWETRRCRYLFREVDERSSTGSEVHLSMSQVYGLIPSTGLDKKRLKSASYACGKLCQKGDLVLNRLKAHLGVFSHAPQSGVVSPDYSVFRPSTNSPVLYFEALFKTPPYVAEFRRSTKGIVEGFWRLYSDDFYNIRSLLPPVDEQEKIVAFLRAQDRQIARFIRDKRRLIELLNEQKQNIIHRAVTRGLDPDVRLKPSNIEWLGDVPEHWGIRRVRTVFENLNYRRVPLSGLERQKLSGNYDYYGASGVIDKVSGYLFDEDLLLIAEDGANLVLRNLPLAIIARGKYWVNNHAHILRPRCGILEYLALLMEVVDYRPWISGAAQPKLTKDRLMSIQIPVPPDSEQSQILEWVCIETQDLQLAVERARTEINLIREYRERLITDVVTGKIDVRSWTPSAEDLESDEELLLIADTGEEAAEEEDGDDDD